MICPVCSFANGRGKRARSISRNPNIKRRLNLALALWENRGPSRASRAEIAATRLRNPGAFHHRSTSRWLHCENAHRTPTNSERSPTCNRSPTRGREAAME